MKWWERIPWSWFSECSVISQPFLSPLSPSSRGSLVPLHFLSLTVVSSVYLRFFIFLPAILIPAWASSSLAFHMIYSAYKLNKQGNNMQPWRAPFPIQKQSIVSCLVLTVVSWTCTQVSQEAGKVAWYFQLLKNFPQFVVIHKVKGFVDIFLEFSCFFCDPMGVGNLTSCFSAFSKSSLYIWKFSIHVLLKPSLKGLEHYLASMWDECNCVVVWTFFGIALLWDWNENWPFAFLWPLWVFQICWHIDCSTFTASYFRV